MGKKIIFKKLPRAEFRKLRNVINYLGEFLYDTIYIYIYIYTYVGAKGDWDFRISDLVKNLDGTDNPCGEFR